MRNRNLVTIHGVRSARSRLAPIVEMSDELVAEQIEVDPARGGTAFWALQ
jgi:hypothetical protein